MLVHYIKFKEILVTLLEKADKFKLFNPIYIMVKINLSSIMELRLNILEIQRRPKIN
jgi:hypothetical protein